jgi:hypothetical protein
LWNCGKVEEMHREVLDTPIPESLDHFITQERHGLRSKRRFGV